MDNESVQKLKVLYVGNDNLLINDLNRNENFELISKENGLLASWWLTSDNLIFLRLKKKILILINMIVLKLMQLYVIFISGMNAYHFFIKN